ncbi:hypothetical protein H5410_050988 [Solanum commersonii]|uniref:Replication factor A C-terminal domain-containing protein n=1 Tax=Solanum commersonii TaxID=4109 RepID=A0A9J5WWY9_SOLCO|nr:hypothetical protein H5410_050988 [Solanum commersonii]
MIVDSTAEIGIFILIAIIMLKYTCLHIHALITFNYVLYKQIYWQLFFVVVLKNTQVAVIISVEKLPFVTIIIIWLLSWYLMFSPHALRKNQFHLTLLEDFGEIEGNEIEAKMETEANLIAQFHNTRGSYLPTSNRTHQLFALKEPTKHIIWCKNREKGNKTKLLGHASEKTSTSSFAPPMVVTPVGRQVIFIAEISSPTSMELFYVEAEMAISNELQEFCVLEFSGCKQKKCTKDRNDFECPKCNRKTTLVPQYYTFELCIFQIDLIDGIGTTTTSISGEVGEKLLFMTTEDIFDITCAKSQSLSVNHVHEMLSSKLFQIQLRKLSWGSSNSTPTILSILSYVEKEKNLPPSTTAAGSSSARPKFEPPTPTKKV